MNPRYLYIFLDESGDFNFSPKGSRFFLLTAITKERPFEAPKAMHDLRYDLLEQGVEVAEYFHATEDKQAVRDGVFAVIEKHLGGVRIDSIVIEKAKTIESLKSHDRFYPKMLGYLLRYVMNGTDLTIYHEVLVFVASLHTGQQKKIVQKAVKQTLAEMLPTGAKYRLIYQSAKSNYDIQIADYCTWAVFKKWAGNELRPYNIIKTAIRSEFDIFKNGNRLYY